MPNDLQTTRGRTFFWIGLLILPVFWVWWMTPRCFSQRQINRARIWTITYGLLGILAWWTLPPFRERVVNFRWTYSLAAFQIGAALWLWLLFRIMSFPQVIMSLLMGIDTLAMLWGPTVSLIEKLPPEPAALIYIAVPAAVHLSVEPVKALLLQRLDRHLENEARRNRANGPGAQK